MPSLDQQIADARIDRSQANWRLAVPKPSVVTFDPACRYLARMATAKGTMGIELYHRTAPMHVTSFAYLAGLGFYDGLPFHRVIRGFMAQGGCPLGTGTSGPGYQMNGEYSSKAVHDKPGILSTANAGPGTDGSQFFLTFVPTPWLDGKHTVFGCVVEGQDVLQALEAAGSETGRTREPLPIESIRVEARP